MPNFLINSIVNNPAINDLPEQVLKKHPKDKEREKFKSDPFGVEKPSFLVWFTQTKTHPAEDMLSFHIEEEM